MTEQQTNNLSGIETLLGSRLQLLGWLEKLEEAGARAPEQVKAKVRTDYRARLAQVVTQLSTHGDLIASRLDGLRAQARELRQLRGEEREVRAEAELRHTVGEYTDDEWQLVELDSSGKIEEFDHELERLLAEIRRLEEVQALITTSGPVAKDEAHPVPAEASEADPEVEIEQQPSLVLLRDSEAELPRAEARPEAPRFTPRSGSQKSRESGPMRAIQFGSSQAPAAASPPQDELAFLRSVTLDPSTTRLTPQSAPTTLNGVDREERPSQTVAKTLKCGECGSLNRPTEWYCERCGAELAAL